MKRLKNAEIEKEMKSPQSSVDDDFIGQPRIVIIGCGGAGNNTVNRMHHMGVPGRRQSRSTPTSSTWT